MSVQDQWSMKERHLSNIRQITRTFWESLDDAHSLPVQDEVVRRRGRTRHKLREFNLGAAQIQRLRLTVVLRFMSWFFSFTRVRDRERGGVEDPKLTVERFHDWAAHNGDDLTVQVSISPGETEEIRQIS